MEKRKEVFVARCEKKVRLTKERWRCESIPFSVMTGNPSAICWWLVDSCWCCLIRWPWRCCWWCWCKIEDPELWRRFGMTTRSPRTRMLAERRRDVGDGLGMRESPADEVGPIDVPTLELTLFSFEFGEPTSIGVPVNVLGEATLVGDVVGALVPECIVDNEWRLLSLPWRAIRFVQLITRAWNYNKRSVFYSYCT